MPRSRMQARTSPRGPGFNDFESSRSHLRNEGKRINGIGREADTGANASGKPNCGRIAVVNMVIWSIMKTTIEIPDPLFRKAKATAAERGQSLKELVAEALQEKLASRTGRVAETGPPWMRGFGKLRGLHRETQRIQAMIDEVFESIDPEDRA